MTTFESVTAGASSKPPHIPLYSLGLRLGFAALMAVIAALCWTFDFPFKQIGIFQPIMYGLGVVLIAYVIDIPFRKFWHKLAMIDIYLVAIIVAWLAWYTKGQAISFSAPSSAFWSIIWPFAGPSDWIASPGWEARDSWPEPGLWVGFKWFVTQVFYQIHWVYLEIFQYVGFVIQNVFMVVLAGLIIASGILGAIIGAAALIAFPFFIAAGACAIIKEVAAPKLNLSRNAILVLGAVLGAMLFALWGAYTGWGFFATQNFADQVWKVIGLFIFLFTLAAGVWNAPYANFHSKIAAIPMMFIVIFAFVGCAIWSIAYSTSDAKIYPIYNFVGLKQYYRLFVQDIWSIAVHNALVFILLGTFCSFVIGFLLAVFMDQKIRLEGLFRTIYLYPFALSFIVTGHVWAWIFSPAYGLEKSIREFGWTSFSFSWISDNDLAIYCCVIAALWQGSGLVMALMLAGLRGIDDEVWKAARVDGIPKWRTYLQIVIPMMRPVLVTSFVIIAAGNFRVYDIIVALTDGGPGVSTSVPSQYVYKYLFSGSIGQGLAASTVMLLTSAIILIPWVYVEFVKNKQAR